MNVAHQRFERSQINASFACRLSKGVHRAVEQVQKNLQRFPYVLRFDVQGYFASISHHCLKLKLARMFKGSGFLKLLDRIIDAHQPGLPIGLLTSQYFANAYLEELDHAMLALGPVKAYVRYMDDIAVWADSLSDVQCIIKNAQLIVRDQLGLIIKPNYHIGNSKRGLLYCGFRVKPGVVLPSSRKMTRFRQAIKAISSHQSCSEQVLQRATDIALAGLHGTQAIHFRRSVFNEFGLLP
jgi:RNA-directed DNA polymerase